MTKSRRNSTTRACNTAGGMRRARRLSRFSLLSTRGRRPAAQVQRAYWKVVEIFERNVIAVAPPSLRLEPPRLLRRLRILSRLAHRQRMPQARAALDPRIVRYGRDVRRQRELDARRVAAADP